MIGKYVENVIGKRIYFLLKLIIQKIEYELKSIDSNAKEINGKKILLITDKISERVNLLSRLWSSQGYKVILIYSKENNFFDLKLGKFETVIKAVNQFDVFEKSKLFSADYIHYLSYAPDLIGYLLINNNKEFIYDYKDLFFNTYSNFKNDFLGKLEIEIINKAKYITRRDVQIFNYIKINNLKINNEKIIYIPEFFITSDKYEAELVQKINLRYEQSNNIVKIAVLGGAEVGGRLDKILYEGMDKILEFLAAKNIKIDIIGKFSNHNNSHQLLKYTKKFININYLSEMPSNDLEIALIDYDFAVFMINNDLLLTDYSIKFIKSKHVEFSGSSKLLSYIKAGLPIITGETYKYSNKFLDNSGYSIKINKKDRFDEYKNLVNLANSNYKKNILQSRSAYGEEVAVKNFSINLVKLLNFNNIDNA